MRPETMRLNETRWKKYHHIERKQKMLALKKLSEQKAFRILSELHQFAYASLVPASYNELDALKIKQLREVHFMFGTVKE